MEFSFSLVLVSQAVFRYCQLVNTQIVLKLEYIQVTPHMCVWRLKVWKMLTPVDLCCVDFIKPIGVVVVSRDKDWPYLLGPTEYV
jgi:NADPH-dependent curcumin reductase CurA